MNKTELIRFFKEQFETATVAYDMALRFKDRYGLVKYDAYIKAYKEAIFKAEQLKE